MGLVAVTVNGREFSLSCDDGQEPRIRRLAQMVDTRAAEFAKSLGQVGESRLILLAALVLADELAEATEALQRAQSGVAAAAPAEAAEAAQNIRGIAKRVEAIAARHKSP